MTSAHKDALAVGRSEGRAVREYLDALESHRPRRGRRRTPESIQRRLRAIDQALSDASPLDKLLLIQERMDLQAELERGNAVVDLGALEAEFVAAVKGYSERKGITYRAWREAGVEPRLLKAAGVYGTIKA